MHETYKFYDPELKKDIDVARETWGWIAVYNDGTELHQFDEKTKRFHQFKEIDQSRLNRFVMRAWHTNQLFSVLFTPGMKLIHFYRIAVLEVGTPNERRVKFYFFGFEKKVAGRVSKSLMFIDVKDNLHLADTGEIQMFKQGQFLPQKKDKLPN